MSIENKFKPLIQTLQQRNISVGISPRHIEAHSPDYCPPVDFSPSSPTPNSPVSSYRIISTEDSLIDEIDEYSNAIFNTFFKPKLFDKTGKISPTSIRENDINSWEFIIPPPQRIPSQMQATESSDSKDYRNSAVSYALAGAILVIIDYETFFPIFTKKILFLSFKSPSLIKRHFVLNCASAIL